MHFDHNGSMVAITATVRNTEEGGRTAPLERRGNVGVGEARTGEISSSQKRLAAMGCLGVKALPVFTVSMLDGSFLHGNSS